VAPGVPAELVALAHDPQTSGGLLAAVTPARLSGLQEALEAAGVDRWVVGRVEASTEGAIALV
jgi:selenophosphate synthase